MEMKFIKYLDQKYRPKYVQTRPNGPRKKIQDERQGKVSGEDTVVLKVGKDGQEVRISAITFVGSDEYRFFGESATARARYLREKSRLPISRPLAHYVDALTKAKAPLRGLIYKQTQFLAKSECRSRFVVVMAMSQYDNVIDHFSIATITLLKGKKTRIDFFENIKQFSGNQVKFSQTVEESKLLRQGLALKERTCQGEFSGKSSMDPDIVEQISSTSKLLSAHQLEFLWLLATDQEPLTE